MRCKKCPMAKDECCTICDQNDFLTAERPLPDQDELLAALKRERTINQQLNAIIENSADTLFATNGNGDIIKVNRAWEQLSQTNREDVLGRNIRDLVSTVISDSSTLATLETKQRATKEQHLLRSGRTSYTTSTPVFTDGVLTMVVSNNRDFCEIERMRAQLEESQKVAAAYRDQIKRMQEDLLPQAEIIANDPETLNLIYRANKVAKVDTSVLITGETGVGKEEYAKYIHRMSNRSSQPFIRVNCAAISSSLIESELFGYEKGAFTGANSSGKRGLFEVADNGTIFLDEIGELPLLMQAKLLRVLQEQELLRVGGTAPIKINVRVISATNRDLKQMIREQTFREDLFYRLSVVALEIPPLRERRNDIFPLIQHFITELNNKYGFHKTLTPDAFQVLKSYSFPGNVRELKNCLEEAVVMSEDDRLTRDSFSCLLQGHIVPCADGERPLDDILLDIEYQYLTNALQEEGSIRKAAARLQMSSTTFARRLKQAEEKLHL